MIPLIQKETVEKKKWISHENILEIIAVAESTPGPIAINAATFIGYKVCGVRGAFSATCGVVLPSFAIMSATALVLQQLETMKAVKYAFTGIRAGVLALLVKALLSMYMQCSKETISYIIMLFAFSAIFFLQSNALIVIIGCALIGLTSTILAGKINC